MPENVSWLIRNWGLIGSEERGSGGTARLEGFGSAIADALAQLAEAGKVGLLTAHDPDTDFLLGWAQVSPSQVATEGQQRIVPNPGAADHDIQQRGTVVIRHWELRERGTVSAHPDPEAGQIVANEVVQALQEEGSGEETFILVEGTHDNAVQRVGWYEPGEAESE